MGLGRCRKGRIRMTKLQDDLRKALQEFVKETGWGQFSYFRWSQWLVENEPFLAAKTLEDVLRSAVSLSLERKNSDTGRLDEQL